MLIGHQRIFERLRRDVQRGGLHHAQLFVGPEGVGKTRVALELAVWLQGGEDSVVTRKHILEGVDSDTLLYLDEGDSLPIKTVREIVTRAGQSHHRPKLIFVIENIGRMKTEAMNALLKTLEEPGLDTMFFLTAHHEDDILPTIRSRAQVSYFQTVEDAVLKAACEGHAMTELLVMFAMGRPGKLKRLMADADYFAEHQRIHERVNQFLEGPDVHQAFALVREFEKDAHLPEMLDILLHRARTFALRGQVPPVLRHLDFTQVMDRIEATKLDLKQNVNRKLVLDNLLLPFAP